MYISFVSKKQHTPQLGELEDARACCLHGLWLLEVVLPCQGPTVNYVNLLKEVIEVG